MERNHHEIRYTLLLSLYVKLTPQGNEAFRRIGGSPENTYGGAVIEKSSAAYQEAYHNADLIISKGMGNYETREERTDKDICFLLVAKCVPISTHLNVPRGMPVCKLKECR